MTTHAIDPAEARAVAVRGFWGSGQRARKPRVSLRRARHQVHTIATFGYAITIGGHARLQGCDLQDAIQATLAVFFRPAAAAPNMQLIPNYRLVCCMFAVCDNRPYHIVFVRHRAIRGRTCNVVACSIWVTAPKSFSFCPRAGFGRGLSNPQFRAFEASLKSSQSSSTGTRPGAPRPLALLISARVGVKMPADPPSVSSRANPCSAGLSRQFPCIPS